MVDGPSFTDGTSEHIVSCTSHIVEPPLAISHNILVQCYIENLLRKICISTRVTLIDKSMDHSVILSR